MKWQKLSKTNLPPRGVKLDITVTRYGKPSRIAGCTYMSSLECFRTEVAMRQIPFKDVTHWAVVTLPGEEDGPMGLDDALDCLADAHKLTVKVLENVGFLPSKDKRDAHFQLRGILAHLQKTADILAKSRTLSGPFTNFNI